MPLSKFERLPNELLIKILRYALLDWKFGGVFPYGSASNMKLQLDEDQDKPERPLSALALALLSDRFAILIPPLLDHLVDEAMPIQTPLCQEDMRLRSQLGDMLLDQRVTILQKRQLQREISAWSNVWFHCYRRIEVRRDMLFEFELIRDSYLDNAAARVRLQKLWEVADELKGITGRQWWVRVEESRQMRLNWFGRS